MSPIIGELCKLAVKIASWDGRPFSAGIGFVPYFVKGPTHPLLPVFELRRSYARMRHKIWYLSDYSSCKRLSPGSFTRGIIVQCSDYRLFPDSDA